MTVYRLFQSLSGEAVARDLMLSDIAREFHISHSHCSFVFHMFTGVHFSDYLTQPRIEKAMPLLCTNPSSQEISPTPFAWHPPPPPVRK